MTRLTSIMLVPAAIAIVLPTGRAEDAVSHDDLLLSDEVVPFEELGKDFPERPRLITEVIEDTLFEENRERDRIIREAHGTGDFSGLDDLPARRNLFGGNPFLAPGELYKGFEIPTGAVWQPVFVLYGTARSALQTNRGGVVDVTEWANRLDLFGNLYLTPTERLLVGIRPLDREGQFTGYQFEGDDEGAVEAWNGNIRTLFFEGDFGELFPDLDPRDEKNLDYGFSVGRQPLNFQDGILMNDFVDSIGITRASLFAFGANAARITALAGFNQVHRGDGRRDRDAFLYGLLTTLDYVNTTIDVDFVFVDGDPATGGDGFHAGIGDTRRIGHWNSTLRLNGSVALEEETASIGDGILLTSQVSRTMAGSDDLVYFDTFWGSGNFTSAARDPSTGGPLGNTGILFASPMLGEYAAPLGNQVGDSVGFALGYQHFIDGGRRAQIIPEIGGRLATDDEGESSLGVGLRFQRAFGQHSIFQIDGFFAGYDDDRRLERDDTGFGIRCEWQVKF